MEVEWEQVSFLPHPTTTYFIQSCRAEPLCSLSGATQHLLRDIIKDNTRAEDVRPFLSSLLPYP